MIADAAGQWLAAKRVPVNIYVLYIHDDRYSVPTIDSFPSPSDEEAMRAMSERLGSSPHYFAIELWQGDRVVAELRPGAVEGDAASKAHS